MIPSVSECLSIMDKYGMLENIKRHSIIVTKVAYVLCCFLIKSGNIISTEKIVAASLLHDIGKTESLKTGQEHTKIGVSICMENGFYEIAEIISEHVILKEFDMKLPCNEKEIVYYSDKRVNHDKVVNLEQRLSYILERYGKGNDIICEAIRKNFQICKKVEEKILKNIPLTAGDIPRLVDQVILDEKKGLIRWNQKISYLQ